MSCRCRDTTFRLLDYLVGFDEADSTGLEGVGDAHGIVLAELSPGAVGASQVDRYLPPPSLAHTCRGCEWFLVSALAEVLRWDECSRAWSALWRARCAPAMTDRVVAVASRSHWLAVSDGGAQTVTVFAGLGATPQAVVPVPNPGPIAITPGGELLAVSGNASAILRFGVTGDPRGALPARPPGAVHRLGVDAACGVWIATRDAEGFLHLWRAGPERDAFEPVALEALAAAFRATALVRVGPDGFCLLSARDCGPLCFDWFGRPTDGDIGASAALPGRAPRGQLLTGPIDSGRARCPWHRVRVDADVPQGTRLEISVATSEDAAPGAQGDPAREGDWSAFPAGVPGHDDWQIAPSGSRDFLVDQPPGRYLFVRVRLSGDGHKTPVVRRLHLDCPRVTSADLLPEVYLREPESRDFTERFLATFDASIADIDHVLDRLPALLDPAGVPESVLPWLGQFLDITFDPAWDTDRRRRILAAAPDLYRRRGTVEGLARAVELVFGVRPVVEEFGPSRPWATIARDARLGAARLFGTARARFRLDRSVLGAAPLRGHGDPGSDALADGAYRFRIHLPPIPASVGESADDVLARVARLVGAQKPAHTVESVRMGGRGVFVGPMLAVGTDTVLAALPAPILGKTGNVRLRRASAVWPGRLRRGRGMRAGRGSVVGVSTVME